MELLLTLATMITIICTLFYYCGLLFWVIMDDIPKSIKRKKDIWKLLIPFYIFYRMIRTSYEKLEH